MIQETRRWGSASQDSVVCLHGVAHHGGVFEPLGKRIADRGHSVVAIDLRGHGKSDRKPPWNTDTHVDDLLETIDSLGIETATLVGHSFGGRVAAALAVREPERVKRLALLDPGFGIDADRALRSAEIERLDWSFATVDGAINAFLSSESMIAPPRDVITAFVEADVRKGPDGRFRFSFCPSAAVVAWSEGTLPPPSIAGIPTLFLSGERSFIDNAAQQRRYEEALGDLLTAVTVANGHNVLWESPDETIGAIEGFLEPAADPVG
ncbi:MAG TPA: alpha/beta hydrolase [Solirubrobacterales bacterium]